MTHMLYRAARKILKPLVRILHRKGMAFGEFSQLAKQVYVEASEELLKADGERPTTSRIAIATGLTRKEVAQLRQVADEDDLAPTGSYNRGVRVMTGWLQDAEFLNAEGKPAVLPILGERGSFSALVSRYSGDMPYRAMLREMDRVGAVVVDGEFVRLLGDGYIPHADENEKLGILGTDVSALIATIDHNMRVEDRRQLYFQRKVSYDNLPVEALPVLKEMVGKDGMDLLVRFNQWLATQDRDGNPQVGGSGRMRAGVGIYYFEEPVSEQVGKGKPDED
ncbi:DUF6502 family protein [Candidatus Thiothrix sp. Deng01]|uniref:DUF6502 family protein n=1 Tax=Candidatus Thiothrix phosphatis TaxID=3112415 RepID=A0ABU6CW59_9GAMM|nr:DUF6502 family protein [Candidatus Thiothrix sp. Deng01]MEB4591014.1 DUF6502 family protein [Candidatus Thiothrix sp. Deng01]